MDDEHDELIARAAAMLRRRLRHDPGATARIVSMIEGRPRRWWRAVSWPSAPFSLATTSGLAAAALLIGFFLRPAAERPTLERQIAAARPLTIVPVSRLRDETPRVPVQFTLRDVRANQVALLGDFNDWSASATPLERGARGGTWSVTLSVTPGRHVYAFLVDGTTWMVDPRAQTTRDLDFGRENSVLIVQAP